MSELYETPDSGVAAERTDLAWGRSGLALLACLAILARRFFPFDTRADHVAAFLLLGAGGLGWAVSAYLRRGRTLVPGAATARRLLLVTVFTTAIALAGFAISLFPAPT